MSVANMTSEARAYYAGGKRAMIDGAPCRVPAWRGNTPGKAFIKAAIEGQVEIDGNSGQAGLSRFRFTPANGAREDNRKPSKRKGYSCPETFKSVSGWKPVNLACDPYACHTFGGLTDTPGALAAALRDYHKGDAGALRDYLAATAGERRAYWAAVDAARNAETASLWRMAA